MREIAIDATRPYRPAPAVDVPAGYAVVRKLGEGSAGVVYEALQQWPVRRTVALKLLKSGLDPDAVTARFESERQALARMSHPSIAQVFDAGLCGQGQPYLAMEFVDGAVPITEFCDRRRSSLRQRLGQFVQVCDAVQHAHMKGVIHRDIKPSNVLVASGRPDPIPKIIDFGIAKAVRPGLTEQTLRTALGIVVGTPIYMSPEQADPEAGDVDTRSDVYSLGVLLYRLLAGRLPYDLAAERSATLDELLRRIRQIDPPRPSAFLASLGGEADLVAARCRTEGAALRRELRHDLDWIVMTAMAKDRTRRYPTANALAHDVRQHLERRPVTARPPSRLYRAGRFVRRHTGGVVFAAVLAFVLLAFVVSTAVQSARIAAERDRTAHQAEIAEQVADYLTGLFRLTDPNSPRPDAASIREIVDRGAADVLATMEDRPELQARLMDTLGRVYESLGLYDEALPLLERAVEIRGEPGVAEPLDLARSLNNLANVRWRTGSYAGARDAYERSLTIRRSILGPNHADVATALNNLAVALKATGDFDSARAHYEEALAIWERTLGPDHPDVGMTLNNLAVLARASGQFDEALRLIERSVAIKEATYGPDHPAVARALHNRGNLLRVTGRLDEARQVLGRALRVKREKLGQTHPSAAWTLNSLAFLALQRGEPGPAREYHREALEILAANPGPEHPNVLYDRACFEGLAGDPEAGAALLERAVEAGFSSPGLLRDPDLRPLHGTPGYARVATRIRP